MNILLNIFMTMSLSILTACFAQPEPPDFSGVKLGMTMEQIPQKYNISKCGQPGLGESFDKEVGIEVLRCSINKDNMIDVNFMFFYQKLIGMYGSLSTRWSDRDAVHTAIVNKFGGHNDKLSIDRTNNNRDSAGTCFGIPNCKEWRWFEKGSFEIRYSAENGGTTPLSFALFDHKQNATIESLLKKVETRKKEELKKKADSLGF